MTPGEAMRQTQALLRHHGYGVDSMNGKLVGLAVTMEGEISDLATGDPRGAFTATAALGVIAIEGQAFGLITEDGVDPFVGL